MKNSIFTKILISSLLAIAFTALGFSNPVMSSASTSMEFPGLTYKDVRASINTEYASNPALMSYEFTKPADNPVAPGDIFKPKLLGKTATNSPKISNVTSRADQTGSIVIQGEGFTSGKVWVFGQTTAGDGAYYTTQISLNTGTTVTSALDKTKPYGMYLAWVQNSSGVSKPIRVNAANVDWIERSWALQGDEIALYGNNLSYKNGEEKSYVYLRPWGSGSTTKSIKAVVVKVNPYKVVFKVPTGLTVNSDYEVWLHNGHGGEYGWAGPQKLHITSTRPENFPGRIINVTSYGATAAAGNDDSSGISAAISAAKSGDVLYFPQGNYVIGTSLYVDKAIWFKGDGIGKSIIQTKSGYRNREDGLFSINAVSSKFTGLSFVDKQTGGMSPRQIKFSGGSRAHGTYTTVVDGCSFEKAPAGKWDETSDAFGVIMVDDFTVKNCKFTVPNAMYLAQCSRVKIYNNDFCGNWVISDNDGVNMIQMEAPKMVDISDNYFYASDLKTDPNGTLNFGDLGVVRAIVVQLNSGTSRNLYYAGNKIDRVGNPNNNCGEVLMFESPFQHFADMPVTVSGTDLKFATKLPSGIPKGAIATIVYGKGEGQSREVVSVTDGNVKLLSPWTIAPDSTSRIMFTNTFFNVTVYKNNINGFNTFNNLTNAGSGIQAYGNMVNFRVTSNSFSNLMNGVRLTPHYNWPSGNLSRDNFAVFNNVIIEKNSINRVCWGINLLLSYSGQTCKDPEIVAHMAYNVMIRDNLISNIKNSYDAALNGLCGQGIAIGTPYKEYAAWNPNKYWNGDWIKNTVVENNTILAAASASIILRKHQGSTILRNNTFAYSSSSAMELKYEQDAAAAVIAPKGPYEKMVITLPAD